MGWFEEEAARLKGQQQGVEARVRAPGELEQGGISGFISSAGSSVLELFGQNPTEEAERFRNAAPIMGFVSEMLPTMGVYGAAFKVSKLPMMARGLERTMARTGISALERPIAYGAVKEMARYTPFELSRLGIGFATAPEENYGNLLADVGLSYALGGAAGAIGGYFRSGGKLEPVTGKIRGADVTLKPTFELRMGLATGAETTGTAGLDARLLELQQQVLTDSPLQDLPKGASARFVGKLEEGDLETDLFVNQLFGKVTTEGSKRQTGLTRQLVIEGAESSKGTLNEGEQAVLFAAAGFKDAADFAAHAVYPRLTTITSPRAAGAFAKLLDESTALQHVGDGVMMAREADSGLFVIAKRVRRGDAENTGLKKGPQQYGAAGVAKGDQYLVLKTDKPQRFVPEVHKVAESNVATWAMMRESFKPQPATADWVNKGMDFMQDAMSPIDHTALSNMPKQSWVSMMSGKLAGKIVGEMGLQGSATAKRTAEYLHDIFRPSMFKESQDPLYARLVGMLNGSMRMADEKVGQIIQGSVKFNSSPARAALIDDYKHVGGFGDNESFEMLIKKLNADELKLVVKAATAQLPADALGKLTLDGVVSKQVTEVVTAMQKINKDVLEQLVIPALDGSGMRNQFQWLEGYIMPRMFKGDWHVQVVDDTGAQKWLATAFTGAGAKEEAAAVVEEAAARGLKWKQMEGTRGAKNIVEYEGKELEAIGDMVREQMGRNADGMEVVTKALRRLDAQRAGNPAIVGARAPATMTKTRSGAAGSPDRATLSHDDVIGQVKDHYSKLLRFAAHQAWKGRWMPEAMNLSKNNDVLYKDLMRKANQHMGIDGQLTKGLNNALAPLLGHKGAMKIAAATNELMFAWNIGIANPTFALLNLLTPLQTVAPWIAFMDNAPTAEIAKHFQMIPHFANGRPVGVGGMMHPMKVLGASLQDMRNPTPEMTEVFERLVGDGTVMPHVYEAWAGTGAGVAKGLRETYQQEGGWAFIRKTSTYMAEKSEQFSRMIAASAAYRVGKHHFGLEGDALYRFTQKGVQVTMYGYGVTDRARVMTGPVGSVFGLFKNWQFHFIGQMAQYAGLGMKHNIWSPMLWQGGAALAVGGVGATPLKMMADGLAKWSAADGEHQTGFKWMQENWHDAADEIYFGLPALLGMSLQASSTLPGTDVRNDVTSLTNFVFLERAKAVGLAVSAAYEQGKGTNTNALSDPNIRDKLLQALAPRAVFRAFASAEGDYIKSMAQGYPAIRGVSPMAQFMHGAGFNALEVERQQVAARELYNDQTKTRAAVQSLGANYAQAMLVSDQAEMERVIQRVQEMGLPISSVMASAQTRMGRELTKDTFSRFDGVKAQQYLDALGGE